jgi:Flp pilus assembly protein TadB
VHDTAPNRKCPTCGGVAIDATGSGVLSLLAADAAAFVLVIPLLAVGAAVHVVGYVVAFGVFAFLLLRRRTRARTFRCLACKAEFEGEL